MAEGLHVVTVRFLVKPGFEDRFREAMVENARRSLADEPGCRMFDVCERDGGAEIYLYELYDSADAFSVHLASGHFKAFDETTGDWVTDKRVETYSTLTSSVGGK